MTRKHEPEQQRDDRPEVAASRADMSWNRTGQWTFFAPVYRDQPAPCAVDCPLGIPVARYLHLMAKGRLREAWQVLSGFNPLPAATGRVCYHACELNCNRAAQDQAVNIHQLERYLGDLALEEGWELPAPAIELEGPPVIMVGSGPAGLGSAYVLRSQGYPVVVFERETSPGGMLRVGVPEFRMPRRPLDGEIARLERLGVEFRCGQAVDDLDQVAAGARGLLLATGAHGSRDPGIEYRGLSGARFGLEFLKEYNNGRRPRIGRSLAVVGGGNTAIDVARAAVRLGAEVRLYYRRSREQMPAHPAEISQAEGEGVIFHFLTAPVALLGDQGKVRGLRLTRMTLGATDDSGRARPVTVPGSEFEAAAETVVFAIGEQPELDYLRGRGERAGLRLKVDGLGRTSLPGVFAAGDIAPGEFSVSHALAAGIAAGRNLHLLLSGQEPPLPAAAEPVRADRIGTDYFPRGARQEGAVLIESGPRAEGEVQAGLAATEAAAEAARCYSCGTCTACDNCLIFCPDLAIYSRREGEYLVRTEYCKGCGICAAECPRGVINLEKKS